MLKKNNPEIVITEIILQQFKNMGENYGSVCSQELIDHYNSIAKKRLK